MTLAVRLTGATLIALSGALVMIAMIGPNERDAALFVVAFLGAFLAGLRMAPYFGKPGGDGVLEAVIGTMFATLLGAVIAGLLFSFLLPGGGIVMIVVAPFVVLTALASFGTSALIWVLTMCITHLVMLILRQWCFRECQS